MKHVIIYGPPAVGKLTVADKLAKLTGYRVLHNHLFNDLISEVIPFGTGDYFDLAVKFRLEMFKLALLENVSIISTFCYDKRTDQKFIDSIVRSANKYKSSIHFVQLICDKEELFKRVKEPSRSKFRKLKTKVGLEKCFKRYDLFNKIKKYPSLTIDNTSLSPKKVAKMIKEHYQL